MQLLKLLVFGFSKLKPVSSISTILGTPHLHFRAFMLLLFLSATGSVVGQATVTTDKSDYSPGMNVVITGTGWQPGETVTFQFEEDPKPSTCILPHDLTAVADSSGNIYNNQFLIKENHLGVTFTLTARGTTSGLIATTVFTDAGIGNVTASSTALCPGSVFNVSIQKTAAGGSQFPSNVSFYVELSDASGLFNSPVVIGSFFDASGGNGTIQVSCTIPLNSSYGTGYRVRARSENPITNTSSNAASNAITISTSDIYESYAILNFGSTNVFYDLKAATGNADFNGANLGTFNGTQTLLLNGAENKIFKCGSRDVTNGTLYYRIYPTGSPSGSFINLNLPFASNDGGAGVGCQNQTWRRQDAGVNILSGLCDGNYTIEIYTGANYQGCGIGEHLANNAGANYKATFTVNSSGQSGVYQSAVILKLNGGGDTYYDLQGTTPNFDFSGNLGSFCTTGSLVIAGGENKTFKCPNNDIIDKNKLFYRIYPVGNPSGAFTEIPLSFASNDAGALCAGGQNQTWRSNSGVTNLIAGLSPGNYTIEVYTQASYTTNGICENIHFSNNGGANFKADFTVNEAPIITTVYSNISGNNDLDKCGAEVTFAVANATGTPAPSITYSHQSGSLFPVGTTTVTVTATNSCGIDTKTFTVTVTDNQDPTITAPAAVGVDADNGSCAATNVALGSATTADNCGVASVTNNAPSSFPVGSTTVTWTVTDVNGRTATATQIVTVTDNQDPTITAPAAVNVNADNGSCAATNVVLGSATTADNCGVGSVTNNAPASFPVGPTTVTWTVTDVNGRTATATQVVTVTDNQDPTITAPSAVNVNADNGSCAATNVALGSATTADNCGVASVTNNAPSSFPVGSTTVTWTVTDVNGRTATATQVVTVTDNQDPTITAPAAVGVDADNGSCAATNVALGLATTADNCGVASVTNNAPASFPVGLTTVTWTVTDVNGRTATATQVVTVTDNQDPTITAPATVNVNADNGSCAATNVALGSATTADNCGVASVTNNAPSSFPVGSTTVTWTVTDVNGRTATATQVVTVTDNQNPVISNTPADITVYTGVGSTTCNKVVTWTAPTASDNCAINSFTGTHTSGASFVVGTTTVTYTATDVNGNSVTSSFTVTVIDNTAPVVNVQNFTLNLTSSGTGTITAAQINNGSTDNCGIASVVLDKTNFTCADLGSQTVTLTVTDIHGNSASANATVLVKDVTPPTVLTKNITVNLDASGNASITAAQVDNGSSDVCGPVTLSVSPSVFNCSNTSALSNDLIISEYVEGNGSEKYIEIYNGTGNSINLSDYRLRLYANGATTPTNDVLLSGTLNSGSAIVYRNSSATLYTSAIINAAVNFNGDDAIVLWKISTGSPVDIFGVIGNDPGASWTSGGNTTVDKTLRRKPSVKNGVTVNPTGTGAGAFTTLSTEWDQFNIDDVAGLGSHTMNAGGNPVTLTVTDGSGNQSTGTAYVTVVDNISPTLTPAANQNVNLGASCSIVVPDVRGTATDNCAGVTITQSPVAGSSISLTHNQTTNITVTATDASGNATVKTVVLTAKDVTPPVLTPAANQNVNLNSNCSIVVPSVLGTATDNCAGVTITQSPVAGTVIPLAHNQTYNITVTATDAAGLTDIKTVVLTAKDVTAPTVITKNITVQLDANGTASITAADVNNGSTDNCGTVNLVSVTPSIFNCSNTNQPSATELIISEYVEGNSNIKYLEIYNGTSAAVNLGNYSLRVYSNGSSTVTASNVLSGTLASGAAIVYKNSAATGYDGASTPLTMMTFNGDDAVALFNNSTNQFVDIIGKIGNDPGASWTGTNGYTTLDATLRRKAAIRNGVTVNPTGTGASAFATLTTEWELYSTDDVSGLGAHFMNTGNKTAVTLLVNDGNGNTASGYAYVTVQDNIKPVITTNGDKTVNTDAGVCGATVTVSANATDNCSVGTPTGVRSDGLALTALYPVGTTTIKWNVTDVNGNAAIEVTQTVVVTDNEKPVITANGDKTVNTDPGVCGATVVVSASATDNCSVGTPTGVRSDGLALTALYPVGTTTIKWNVTDVNGNAAIEVTQTVVVTDNEKPNAVAQSVTIYLDASGAATTTAAAVNNGSSDNCGVVTLTLSKTDFNCSNVGNNTVTLTVLDVNGNSSTTTAVVIVKDEIAPTAIAQNVIIYLNEAGTASTTAEAVNNGSSDNCGISDLLLSKTDFDCSNVGNNTVTLTVTDVNGNSSTATATVTVIDNIAPNVITQNVTVQLDASGNASITAAQIDNGSTDACGIATRVLDVTTFTCANIGANTVTLTVTDVNGNVATKTAVVTVKDEVAPNVITQNITVQLDASGNASITPAQIDNGSTDACGIATRVLDVTTFTCANIGANTVTLTVTDVNGNVATKTAVVTVKDEVAPNVITQNITVQLDASGNASITAAQIDNGSTDACGIATRVLDIASFTCSNVGANTVTLTVTDVNGNVATKTAVVTVKDEIAPTAVAQNVTIYLNASGTASTTAAAVNNGSSDNCGIATLALSNTSFDCSNVGANTVTLTVTDINGNSSTTTAIVTVKDEVAPVAKCQNIAVYLDQAGTVSISASQINNGSTDACGIASISISQTLFTAAGTYPVVLTVTDINGNSSTCSATVTVNKRPVTIVYNGDNNEQYSDQQTLTATLTDEATGNPLSGKTINFSIGAQTVSAVTNASGVASATLILTQNPDAVYTVTTAFAGDAVYLAANDTDAFDIKDEDARAEYIGTQFQATSSATSGVATVQLQASILDITAVTDNPETDPYAGTITNARVKFVLYNGSTFTDISGWLTPALINSSDSKVGVVSYDWAVNIGTSDASQYNVGIIIDNGYYVGEAPVNTITVVTVYKPMGDFVTGGGYIIPTQSAGTYASTLGLKMNFGLNVKYNKKGTNLQGGVNMIFRRNVGGVIRTYQIKSNSMTSLGTSGTSTPVVDRYAEFLSKANLTDVTNPLAPVALGGNLDLRVSMRDRGEPGSTDEIAVTLFNGTGSLLFSSKWTGSSSQRMLLTGGNIVIRGDNYGAAPAVKLAGPSPSTNSISDDFNVKVLGNPSLSSFRLQLQSSDKQQKITVKVVDVSGHIVEVKENLYAGQVIEVGAKYTQGTYFAEVMQGTNRKTVKLLKVARD